ncbi:O-antigen ligase family protein [Megamonas funiformis]|uniref:O-antigen ligase family protein n=1 Tax=Megamonas funiformis TaxID=437897 RepID=UPI00265CEB50|nr:O-antigen ligase family protein [Megamonas funiformis]
MISVNNILEKCIFFSICLATFDGLNIYNIGLFQRGYVIPTVIGIILYFFTIKNKKIYLNKTIKCFVLFVVYSICISIFNINNIMGVEFKNQTAENNLIATVRLLLLILCMLLYYTEILIKKERLIEWIYRGIKYSFYVVAIISFIQIFAMMGIEIAQNIQFIIEPYINVQISQLEQMNVDLTDREITRVHGVSQEASSFGNYLMIVFPWLCLGAVYFDKSLISKAFCIFAVIFAILSYSRIAYGCMFLEIVILIFLSNKIRKYIFSFKFMLFFIIFLGCIIFYIDIETIQENFISVITSFFISDGAYESSNLTRLGLQYTAFDMFLSKPLIGFGLGQFQFNAVEYIPEWAYFSAEIRRFANAGDPTTFIGTFNTHIRVLVESGIVGGILWFYIAWHGLKNYLIVLKYIEKDKKLIIKCIIISYIFSFLSFINFDDYIIFYYWFLIVLSETLLYKVKKS